LSDLKMRSEGVGDLQCVAVARIELDSSPTGDDSISLPLPD